MNTQLAEQPIEQALPLEQAIEQLIASYHADNEEVTELSKSATKLSEENSFLKLQIATLTGRINTIAEENEKLINQRIIDEKAAKALTKQQDLVITNAEKINQKSTQFQREAEQARNELKDVKIQLKAFKEIEKTPKKFHDKINDYKARVLKERGFAEQHKKNYLAEKAETKSLKKEIMSLAHKLAVSDIIQLHGEGDDRICLFPHQLGDITGYESGQVPLLYMHTSGRASLVLLNEDGEAEIPPAPKGGLRMKKATMDHCSQLLRRFKSQDWKLTDSDVQSIAMQN